MVSTLVEEVLLEDRDVTSAGKDIAEKKPLTGSVSDILNFLSRFVKKKEKSAAHHRDG